ncbi:hypothetical protein J7U46_21090 [Pelomonas sp. V22]|uniref:hypothetical protein n=1 Tax=Pelomonas sp. V22 TaxID=2822139 RepID=UPI0024A89030|nr:hypothetical protein [Pelomonas sp. V22]MDI4635573.1 hypothetical protein [Pelomonas sp. V22]
MRFAPSLRFFRKTPAPVIEHDPADLGTAFGMEASLEGEEAGQRRSSSYELESERAGADSESPLAWLSRPRA